MNLGDLKLYQDFEERKRIRAAKEAQIREKLFEEEQEKYKEIFGVLPQNVINITTNNLLANSPLKIFEILEKSKTFITDFYNQLNDKNDGIDIFRQIPFGKYNGSSVWEVINTDPSYVFWLNKNTEFKLTEHEMEIVRYVSKHKSTLYTLIK